MKKGQFLPVILLFVTTQALAQGNVGIGTSSPNSQLEIKGTAGATSLLNVTDNSGNSRIYVLPAGNVGIGTITPGSYLLNVAGTGRFGGQLDMASNKVVNVTDPTSAQDAATKNYVDNAQQWTLVSTSLYPKSTTYNVGIGTTSVSDKLTINGTVSISNNNWLEFGKGVSGKEASAGKVGYETFTTGSLDIVGAGTVSGSRSVKLWDNIIVPGTGSFYGQVDLNSHKLVNVTDPTSAQDAATKNYVDNHAFWTLSGSSLYPNSTSYNVGIGTSSVTEKLTIAGTASISSSNTLEFGKGVSGKESNAGKIGYQTFTSGALDIVGAGTPATNRVVKLWDNVTVNNELDVTGSIYGKVRMVDEISFNQGSWQSQGSKTMYLPAPGGDGQDDETISGLTGQDNDKYRVWVAPYNGKLVKIIVHAGDNSGSNPQLLGAPVLSVNGTAKLLDTGSASLSVNDNSTAVYTPTQNNTFSRGDLLAVGVYLNSGHCEDTNYFFALVWEYDVRD